VVFGTVVTTLLGVARQAPAGPTVGQGEAKLAIKNVNFSRSSTGGITFFGEIVNRGSGPAGNVGVMVSLLNKAGERLARGVTLTVSRNVIKPGETAVWAMLMTDNPKSWAKVTTEFAEQVGRDDYLARDYRSFVVRNVKLEPRNPGYSQKVVGTVVNTGSKRARVGAVAIAFYDAQGKLIYVNDLGSLYPYVPKQVVPPKKSATFEATVLNLLKPAKTVVHVRASIANSYGTYLP
jgi:hypothetical protein